MRSVGLIEFVIYIDRKEFENEQSLLSGLNANGDLFEPFLSPRVDSFVGAHVINGNLYEILAFVIKTKPNVDLDVITSEIEGMILGGELMASKSVKYRDLCMHFNSQEDFWNPYLN